MVRIFVTLFDKEVQKMFEIGQILHFLRVISGYNVGEAHIVPCA
jgi:hypothetical protein